MDFPCNPSASLLRTAMTSLTKSTLIGLVLFTLSTHADEKPDPGKLTLDRIYSGSEFRSKRVSIEWLPKGSRYTTLKTVDGIEGRCLVLVDPTDGSETVLVTPDRITPSLESTPLSIYSYALSPDLSKVLIFTNTRRVWRYHTRGDYWVLDLSSHDLRKLGGEAQPATLKFAKFSPDSQRVAYVRDRNIYVEDLRSGDVKQLTQTPNDDIINGTFDWVYEEELGLRDGFRWSPDGKHIAYWQINTQGVPRISLVNNTAGHYPELLTFAYPKTGQTNPICRVGVKVVDSDRPTYWIHTSDDLRDNYIARMEWTHDSTGLVIQQLNRLQNTNLVRKFVLDLRDVRGGSYHRSVPQPVVTETDAAWVRVHDEMHWLPERKAFTWLSERDGWRHLYLIRPGQSESSIQQVTKGQFDVIRLLRVDEKRNLAYVIASPASAAQRYLYSIKLDGSGLQLVTPDGNKGWNDYSISPDGRFAIHTVSSFDNPPVTSLISLPAHKQITVLESNEKLHNAVEKLERRPSEFFQVDIGDGVKLDAWCMLPPDFSEGRSTKYPLLIYVYGEPAGQTVTDRWGGSSSLWHQMLAQRGYIIMSIDNRGTKSPRGRDWRKSVYRRIGTLGPEDQAAALRQVLKDRPYIDSKRVGIWGWSGGGSSSLHAIFKYPDLYKTAISIAPVPNQRYYDTIYQERYMGLPSDNVDGYRDGSAMNFAENLKGNLLLIHGTGDDNCHYQTTELLINELIRHNKHFTMMAYPWRSHSIREGKNTTRHLRSLMTRYLEQHLPVVP